MLHTIAARDEVEGPVAAAKSKSGPKGKVLEPYDLEILRMARAGRSMQYIVDWLAEPPRSITITRQAVHVWVKARIKKLVKLNAAFADTGVGEPFQESRANRMPHISETVNRPDPPPAALVRPAPASTRAAQTSVKRVDVTEFMVDESDLDRAQNPLLPNT